MVELLRKYGCKRIVPVQKTPGIRAADLTLEGITKDENFSSKRKSPPKWDCRYTFKIGNRIIINPA